MELDSAAFQPGCSLGGSVWYILQQYWASFASYLVSGIVCGFESFYPQEHLQLKSQILFLFLIMLPKMTHTDANTFTLADHGWLSSSSFGLLRYLEYKKTAMQFLQFVAEVNVPGTPYENVTSY